MKKKTIYLCLAIVITGILMSTFILPHLALAADGPCLPNPLGGTDCNADNKVNVITILLRIIQIALAVVDIFALFMFILGGFEFLISAGNEKMIKKAKDTLIWATLGILVITLSYSILKFIFEEVSKGFGT